MDNVPYQFLMSCTAAQLTLASHRTLKNDVVWPAITCFESLIRQTLLLYMNHDALEDVQFTCLVRPRIDEDSTAHTVVFVQHLKIATLGGSVFESLDEKMNFLAEYAPTHLMGSGTFMLSRYHPCVVGVLANPADSKAVDAFCLELTKEAFSSFKRIDTEFSSSFNQG